MTVMRVDHVSYAAEHDGLQATAERLAKTIGVAPVSGGIHPRFGTRNVILPLTGHRYVEVAQRAPASSVAGSANRPTGCSCCPCDITHTSWSGGACRAMGQTGEERLGCAGRVTSVGHRGVRSDKGGELGLAV